MKASLKDQLNCFKYLDTEDKKYVTYHDFCNLTDERRRKIDPAKNMVDAYNLKLLNQDPFSEPTKRSPKNAISPDERERERQRKVSILSPSDPSSLEDYLK